MPSYYFFSNLIHFQLIFQSRNVVSFRAQYMHDNHFPFLSILFERSYIDFLRINNYSTRYLTLDLIMKELQINLPTSYSDEEQKLRDMQEKLRTLVRIVELKCIFEM